MNGLREVVPLDRLFCSEAKSELERFFSSTKRTTQSRYSAKAAVTQETPPASAPAGDSPPPGDRDTTSNPSNMVIEPGDAEEDGGVAMNPAWEAGLVEAETSLLPVQVDEKLAAKSR